MSYILSFDHLRREAATSLGVRETGKTVRSNALWRVIAGNIGLPIENQPQAHLDIQDKVHDDITDLWKKAIRDPNPSQEIKKILYEGNPHSSDIRKLREKYIQVNVTPEIESELAEIGQDIKKEVLKYLEISDLDAMRLVNKEWHALADHNALWKEIAEKTIGSRLVSTNYLPGAIRPKVLNLINRLRRIVSKTILNAPIKVIRSFGRDISIQQLSYLAAYLKKRDKEIFERKLMGVDLLKCKGEYEPDRPSIFLIPTKVYLKQKSLDLSHQHLSSIIPEVFSCSNLETLDLSHNHIDRLSLELFQLVPKLRAIDLTGNPLSRSQIQELRRAVPKFDFEIEHESTKIASVLTSDW